MEKELENACLGLGEQKTDYLLSDGIADNLPTLYEQDMVRFTYDQGKNAWSKKSCTIFASIGALSDLRNYQFSESEIKEIDNLSYERGRVKGAGWYVQNAVKLVADWWNNKHPDKKVAYYRIDMKNDALVDKVIDKNYNIVSGFYGNGYRTLDYAKDGVLDGTDFGATTYGHAINVIKDKKISIKDNYGDRKYNTYELAHYPSEIKTFHLGGYIFTKVEENNIEEFKRLKEIETLCNTIITDLGSLYNKVNDTNFQGILHYTADKLRGKIKDVENEREKIK